MDPLGLPAGYPGPGEANTALLRSSGKWKGLALDNNNADASIPLYKEVITSNNIVDLFEKYVWAAAAKAQAAAGRAFSGSVPPPSPPLLARSISSPPLQLRPST